MGFDVVRNMEMNEYFSAGAALGGKERKDLYSAKNNIKPVHFYCYAPKADAVFLEGDFNDWHARATPMERQPDGTWTAQIPLHHGHHLYRFCVDGRPELDSEAQGITRNDANQRVSLIAVS